MVTTKTRTRVQVAVWARSTVYVANEITRVIQEIVNLRGLPMDYMHQHLTTIIDGFRTWLTGHWLKGAVLEVYDTGTDRLIERYDLLLSYNMQPSNSERFETQLDDLKASVAQRQFINGGSHYRVIVDLEPGAPSLPGWGPTTFRDTSHLSRQNIGNIIDTARIGVAMEYWA